MGPVQRNISRISFVILRNFLLLLQRIHLKKKEKAPERIVKRISQSFPGNIVECAQISLSKNSRKFFFFTKNEFWKISQENRTILKSSPLSFGLSEILDN